MAKDYYMILGLSKDASSDDIRSAYRRLAKEYHPDHYGLDSAPFLQIQEAYTVLSDPEARRDYDKSLNAARRGEMFRDVTRETVHRRKGFSPTEPVCERVPDVSPARSFQTLYSSFDEIFDTLWGNFTGMHRPEAEIQRPVTADITLTPDEARRGGRVQVYVPAVAACPTCRGRGGVGLWECWQCAGEGSITGEFPIMVEYPAGIPDGHTAMVSLEHLGIHHTDLTIRFRIGVPR